DDGRGVDPVVESVAGDLFHPRSAAPLELTVGREALQGPHQRRAMLIPAGLPRDKVDFHSGGWCFCTSTGLLTAERPEKSSGRAEARPSDRKVTIAVREVPLDTANRKDRSRSRDGRGCF